LEAFQPRDAEFFFGREELVRQLCGRVKTWPFLAVVGPSGSGKSSVVQAGVVPAIWHGTHELGDTKEWRILLFTPGAEPLAELGLRLAAEARIPAGALVSDLRTDP